jgi:hypothetical protein
MDSPSARGEAVLVALGWYVTVIGALLFGLQQTDTGHSCDDAVSWCFTPSMVAGFGVVLAFPVILAGLVISALIVRPLAGSGLSAPVAGTAAAALSGVATVVLALVLLAATR